MKKIHTTSSLNEQQIHHILEYAKEVKNCIEERNWAGSLNEYISTTAILLDQVKLIIEGLEYGL